SGAFQNCTSLKTVIFNDALTTIEDKAFCDCEMLEEAKFGANLSYIGENAFSGCTSLNTIAIPSSVSIDRSTFTNSALKTVFCPNNSDSAVWAIDNNYSVVLSPNDRVPPKHSRLDYDNSTFVMNKTGGYSATLSYKFTELMPGEIKVKIPVYTDLKSISINGKVSEDYTVKDGHIFIPVNDTEGKITISFTQNNGILMPTYATVTYDKGSVTDIIGIINEKAVCNSATGITVSLPDNSAAASLDVVKTEADETKVGYNITLKDKNGKEIQPESAVTVKIPVPYGFDGEKCSVFRKEADGTYTNMEAYYLDGYLIFTTDHFSEYAVSTENLGKVIKLGDVNNDNNVNAIDAKWILQHVSGSRTFSDDEKAAADVNGDGVINAIDAKWLLQVASGSRTLDQK
ncbi:MAG: leucine-rich repeat protein, partial [Ruminiclostridium sp.]|nr:leucine-rich repeat protein [Ruminiclostridium sp.]